MKQKITVTTLYKMKEKGEKITALTAYDYPFAKMIDQAGIHIILVGDSLGMVVQGQTSTLPVTMDEMIYHTKLVSKGVENAFVIGDMPFMSYQAELSEAVKNAGRFLKEAGAEAVKLEGGVDVCETIEAISNTGIPVQAHIGLTPQSVHKMGGYKVQRNEQKLIDDAKKVEAAGAFSVVLEGIPEDISKKITEIISIPTIGIGAGSYCDGQILVLHDCLGLNTGHVPKFAKKFANLGEAAVEGVRGYIKEVNAKEFPSKKHCY